MRSTRFWEGVAATAATLVGAAYVYVLIFSGQPLAARLAPPDARVPETATTPEPRSLLRVTPAPIGEPSPTASPSATSESVTTSEPEPEPPPPPRVAVVTAPPVPAVARATPAPACAAPRLSTWSVNSGRPATSFEVGDSAYARFCVPRVASSITFWVRGPQSRLFSSRGSWTQRSEVVTGSVPFSGPQDVGAWTFRLIADGVGYDASLTVRAPVSSAPASPASATPTATSRATASPGPP